jgi:penicillin amidase/acyl-homoserine-lactone acylase
MTNRGLRATQLFAEDDDGLTSRQELIDIKHDGEYHPDGLALQLRTKLSQMSFENEPSLNDGLDIIRAWDGRTNLENANAALSLATYQPIGVALFFDREPPTLEQSYRDAHAYLLKHHGKLDPPWGSVNRHKRGDIDLPIQGGPDTLRAVNSAPDETGSLVMNSGDGLHYLWESYPDGHVELWGVHQFGSSSRRGDEHFTDQMDLFTKEQYRRIPLGLEDVKASAVQVYSPGE